MRGSPLSWGGALRFASGVRTPSDLRLQVRLDKARAEALCLERLDDLLLVRGAERLDGHAQLHGGVAVGRDKLVVVESDDVALALGDDLGNVDKLAGAVGQEHADREDAVALD